jgi:hypothetical protein
MKAASKLKSAYGSILLVLVFFLMSQPGNGSPMKLADIKREMNAPHITEQRFTQLCAEYVRLKYPDMQPTISNLLEIQVKEKSKEGGTIFLDNAWRQCASTDEPRFDICTRYLDSIKTPPYKDPQLSQVVPVICDVLYGQEMAGYMKKSSHPDAPATQPFVADLIVAYAADNPTTVQYLGQSYLTSHKLNYANLRRIAIANLVKSHAPPSVETESGIKFILFDGTYESSWLLIDSFWKQQAKQVKGDLVAVTPSRGILMFTGSGETELLSKMRKLAIYLKANRDHPTSSKLIVWRNNAWQSYDR